jgi:hypothetical protein
MIECRDRWPSLRSTSAGAPSRDHYSTEKLFLDRCSTEAGGLAAEGFSLPDSRRVRHVRPSQARVSGS